MVTGFTEVGPGIDGVWGVEVTSSEILPSCCGFPETVCMGSARIVSDACRIS